MHRSSLNLDPLAQQGVSNPSVLQQAVDYQGDFLDLLRANNVRFSALHNQKSSVETLGQNHSEELIEGTTVIAIRYQDGVMVAGDRRATAGNVVMYDRADKVLEIDEHSVMAIAGSPAIAYEMARTLEHSFQYFRRTQLQELSVEGKIRMLARLIRDNTAMALQGIGGVVPIFALYDSNNKTENLVSPSGRIFFYDVLGAQFETVDFATSGSGSVWIRGILHYLDRWSETRLSQMDINQATSTILRLLDTAAEFDTATSGTNMKSQIYPIIKTVTQDGVQELSLDLIQQVYETVVQV